MAKRFVIPSLSDVRQDIAGAIPLGLIQAWMDSSRDAAAHDRLVSPFRRRGTIVCSDSAGLSKASRQLPLIDLMKAVSRPKEVIHAYGAAIGGAAVGVWAADNTETYYHDGVDPGDVLDQMIGAQREIARLPVQVGIALHVGEFLEIGGGLFGPEADRIEELAEAHTGAGEIAVTREFIERIASRFPAAAFTPKQPADLDASSLDYHAFNVRAARSDDFRYPYPFNDDFFHFLQNYSGANSAETARILSDYSSNHVVVFIRVHHAPSTLVLNQLAAWVVANAILSGIARLDGVATVKTNGNLGIFLAATPARAVEFALDARTALAEGGHQCNIGVAAGEALVFPATESGCADIAGDPVNIASKISEDIDERGAIYVHESAAARMPPIAAARAFQLTISGVDLAGVRLILDSGEKALIGPQPRRDRQVLDPRSLINSKG